MNAAAIAVAAIISAQGVMLGTVTEKTRLAEGLFAYKTPDAVYIEDNGRIVIKESAENYHDFDDVYADYIGDGDNEYILIINGQEPGYSHTYSAYTDNSYSTHVYSRENPFGEPLVINDIVTEMAEDCFVAKHQYVSHAVSMGDDRYSVAIMTSIYEPDGRKISEYSVPDYYIGECYSYINGDKYSILYIGGVRVEAEEGVSYSYADENVYQKKDNTGVYRLIDVNGNVIAESSKYITWRNLDRSGRLVRLLTEDVRYRYVLCDDGWNIIREIGTFDSDISVKEFDRNMLLTVLQPDLYHHTNTSYVYGYDWNQIKTIGTFYASVAAKEFDGGIIAAQHTGITDYNYVLYDSDWNRIKDIGKYKNNDFEIMSGECEGETRYIISVKYNTDSVCYFYIYDKNFNKLWETETSKFRGGKLENNVLTVSEHLYDSVWTDYTYNLNGEEISSRTLDVSTGEEVKSE